MKGPRHSVDFHALWHTTLDKMICSCIPTASSIYTFYFGLESSWTCSVFPGTNLYLNRSINPTQKLQEGLWHLLLCSKRDPSRPCGFEHSRLSTAVSLQPSPQGQSASPLSLFQKGRHTGPQTLTALLEQLSILSVRSHYGSTFSWEDLGTDPKYIFMSWAQRVRFSTRSGPADCQNTSLIKYSSETRPSDQQEKEKNRISVLPHMRAEMKRVFSKLFKGIPRLKNTHIWTGLMVCKTGGCSERLNKKTAVFVKLIWNSTLHAS